MAVIAVMDGVKYIGEVVSRNNKKYLALSPSNYRFNELRFIHGSHREVIFLNNKILIELKFYDEVATE